MIGVLVFDEKGLEEAVGNPNVVWSYRFRSIGNEYRSTHNHHRIVSNGQFSCQILNLMPHAVVHLFVLRTDVGDVCDLGKVPPPIFSPFSPPMWVVLLVSGVRLRRKLLRAVRWDKKTADTHFCQELSTHATFLFGFCSVSVRIDNRCAYS